MMLHNKNLLLLFFLPFSLSQANNNNNSYDTVRAKKFKGTFSPLVVSPTACFGVHNNNVIVVQDPCNPPIQRFQFVAVQTENVYQLRDDEGRCVYVSGNDVLEVRDCGPEAAALWSVVQGGRLQSMETQHCVAVQKQQSSDNHQLWKSSIGNDGRFPSWLSSAQHRDNNNHRVDLAEADNKNAFPQTGWRQGSWFSTSGAPRVETLAVTTTNCTGVEMKDDTTVLLKLDEQPDDTLGPAPIVLSNHQCLTTSASRGATLDDCRHGHHEDQQWELLRYGDAYQIRSEKTSLCLGLSPYTAVVSTQNLCTLASTLLWRVQHTLNTTTGTHTLSSVHAPQLCLAAHGGALVLTRRGCETDQFRIDALPMRRNMLATTEPAYWLGPSPLVRNKGGICVAVNSEGHVSEALCKNGEFEQLFRVTPSDEEPYYAIRSTFQLDMCLGVENDQSNAKIISVPCGGGGASSWHITNDRQLRRSHALGLCLTSPWIHRQTGLLTGWISIVASWIHWLLEVSTGWVSSLWSSFPTTWFLNRTPVLGPCDDAARNTFDAVDMGIDPWEGPFHTPLVASAMANRPDDLKVKEIKTDNRQTWVGVFDPDTGLTVERLITEFEHDMFCPATVHLADGRLMVSGGSNNFKTTFYHPETDQWEGGPDHTLPRGYHSGTLLSDGSVLVIGGSWKVKDSIGERDGALWTPASNSWQVLPGIRAEPLQTNDVLGPYRSDNHMWLYEAPDGRMFHAGPAKRMHWISIEDETITPSILRGDDEDAMNGASVMYDVGKIACFGGAANYDDTWASARTYIVDINQSEPTVTRANDMSFRRAMHNAVVLPDGKIIIIGGVEYAETFRDNYMVLTAELFNPDTLSFTQIPTPMKVPRNYHSSALLLKDGRVLAAGGGLCGRCAANHPDGEILTPPYLLDENGQLKTRPAIESVSSATIQPGSTMIVEMDTATLHTFTLVRFGASTHSVNLDQRRVPLSLDTQVGSSFTLRLPSNVHALLPGYYFLFAMNADGVPSIAQTVFRPL